MSTARFCDPGGMVRGYSPGGMVGRHLAPSAAHVNRDWQTPVKT